jgi:hypothetical protein
MEGTGGGEVLARYLQILGEALRQRRIEKSPLSIDRQGQQILADDGDDAPFTDQLQELIPEARPFGGRKRRG